ncbi:MAG: STN domain-containing protein [Paramuribaculum sp.]|nr:STN domain-containing protein [Paramuribaculum sp.]
MKRYVIVILVSVWAAISMVAQNVTIHAVNQPASAVFRTLVEQTGWNFVYASDLLADIKVSVNAKNKPLKKVLDEIFKGTDIVYKIKGNNVILKRKSPKAKPINVNEKSKVDTSIDIASPNINSTMLDEVVVVSRLEAPAVETAEIGAKKITADEVRNTPALLGEADVIKALQMQPGLPKAQRAWPVCMCTVEMRMKTYTCLIMCPCIR